MKNNTIIKAMTATGLIGLGRYLVNTLSKSLNDYQTKRLIDKHENHFENVDIPVHEHQRYELIDRIYDEIQNVTESIAARNIVINDKNSPLDNKTRKLLKHELDVDKQRLVVLRESYEDLRKWNIK